MLSERTKISILVIDTLNMVLLRSSALFDTIPDKMLYLYSSVYKQHSGIYIRIDYFLSLVGTIICCSWKPETHDMWTSIKLSDVYLRPADYRKISKHLAELFET